MVPAGTGLPVSVGPNCTSAVPTVGGLESGAVTVTVQSSAAFCDHASVTVCAVPSESYTVMSDEIGEAAVAVPAAGVAGRLADNVTFCVATGLSAVCVTWIGESAFWLTTWVI